MLTGEMNDYIEERLKNPEIKRYVKRVLIKGLDCDPMVVTKSRFRFKDGRGELKFRRLFSDRYKVLYYDQNEIYDIVKQAELVCLPDAVGSVVLKLFERVEGCFRIYNGYSPSIFDPLMNEINGARNRSHELMRMFGFDPHEEYNRLEKERRR